MIDGPSVPHRRTSDAALGTRVTVIEVEMRNLGQRFERHAAKSDELIAKLDARADKQDVVVARLLAGLAVLMFLGQVFAPFVGRLLGLPT